ncbi:MULTISPECIES: S1 family peptidase [Streptomyces]|uniref:Serine protease n=1 Tax=Streptomyces cacaoi TaxID=1898 RepID=A0A4Y3R8L8_STRCI|nr:MULTISPECIES: serine protease [Streptomyces]NNG89426.1 trypsin-like peptidase domain-containing protein [Streptomyces cacaoi]QHF97195.1 serine protease [Streptomyces sp. NHF165]GEB53982.1 serine protease [Streptomyces cacaoi]
MKRPLVGSLAAAFFGAAAFTGLVTSPATAATAEDSGASAHKPAAAPGFEGTVALSNCSGSVVRMPDSQPDDPALVLSNGHCLEEGMPGAGEVITDQPSSRSFTLLKDDGGDAGTIKATKIAYATMTDTDVSLYEVGSSYADIESQFGVKPLDLEAAHPEQGKDITVVSGYWKETYSCAVDGFVPTLKEADWTMKDSIRYTAECQTKGGTSGSPVVDDATGKVVGVNNTRNENGQECTMNNPCEVDENGEVTVREGIGYGQQTYLLAACIGDGNQLDLGREGCTLPKP